MPRARPRRRRPLRRPTIATPPPTAIPTEPTAVDGDRVQGTRHRGRARHRQDGVRGGRAAAALGDHHEHGQERVRAERRHEGPGLHDHQRRRAVLGLHRLPGRPDRRRGVAHARHADQLERADRVGPHEVERRHVRGSQGSRCRRGAPRTTSRSRSTDSRRRPPSSSSCTEAGSGETRPMAGNRPGTGSCPASGRGADSSHERRRGSARRRPGRRPTRCTIPRRVPRPSRGHRG